jgi:hypothetical protein
MRVLITSGRVVRPIGHVLLIVPEAAAEGGDNRKSRIES